MVVRLTSALAAALLVLSVPAMAQNVARARLLAPNANVTLQLVRTSILTLNDALQTGNFTVMRDRGAPGFRQANTAAQLSRAFAGLLAQHMDLAAVSTMTPRLARPPSVDANNRLRVTGHFLSPPIRLDFDLLFVPYRGKWRLLAISVNPVRIKAASTTTAAATKANRQAKGEKKTKQKKKKKKKKK